MGDDFCPYTYDELKAGNEPLGIPDEEEVYGGPKYNIGLWLVPSYFNHSCVPNCQRVFFGDTMFLYANKDGFCKIVSFKKLSINHNKN